MPPDFFSRPRIALGTAILALLGGQCLAADPPPLDPAARMQDELRRADRAAPPPPATPPRVAPAPPWAAPEPATLAGTVVLKEVLFSPSELLEDAELHAVARPYLGREVSSQDLNALLRAIQALYLGKGIQTAVPVLPQQDLRSGTMRVLLVEGRLGAVKVEGATGIDPAWVGRWFDLASGAVIRPADLERRLGVFNAASDFWAQAAYVPGAEFGRSDLLVQVPQGPRGQFWALFDMPETGLAARSSVIAGYRLAPLGLHGGRIDVMAIAGRNANTFSVAASVPLGQQGWRLGGSATGSRSRNAFKSTDRGIPDLVSEGDSSSVGLELGRHLAIAPRQSLLLSGSATRIRSKSTISGFVLSERTVDKLTLAAATDWPAAQPGDVSPASLRGAVTTARGPVSSYGFAEVAGLLATRLGAAGAPVLRISGQARLAAFETTDATDAWLAGGGNSVRGFDSGAATGQRGHALQLALSQPIALAGLAAGEAYAFADHARALGNGGSRGIASAGAGLQFQLNRHLAVDTTLARQIAGFQGARTRLSLRASANW